MVDLLGFRGRTVSVAATQLCHDSSTKELYIIHKQMKWPSYNETYFTKTRSGPGWASRLLPSPALGQRFLNHFVTLQNYSDTSTPKEEGFFICISSQVLVNIEIVSQ